MGCNCRGGGRSTTTAAAARNATAPQTSSVPAIDGPTTHQYVVRCADGGSQVFLNLQDAARVAQELGCTSPVAQPIIGGMVIPR